MYIIYIPESSQGKTVYLNALAIIIKHNIIIHMLSFLTSIRTQRAYYLP